MKSVSLIFLCLASTYVALTAHQFGAAALAVDLPALAMVFAARQLSPGLTVLWAFGIGLCLDAMEGGLLGVHAASLVVTVWLLMPILSDDELRPSTQFTAAVLLAVLIDGLTSTLQQPGPDHEQLIRMSLHLAATMFVTAAVAAAMAFLGRRAFGPSCTTR